MTPLGSQARVIIKIYLCGESATEDNLLYLFPDTPAVPLGCTGELC